MTEILLSKIRELEGEAGAQFDVRVPIVRSSSGANYFAKIGKPTEHEQYRGEIESLKHIASAAPGICPNVLSSGSTADGRPYCISEYKDLHRLSSTSAQVLAKRLATEMHKHKSHNSKFGFAVPTFCGATRLANGWYDTWDECYDALIGGLLDGLAKQGGSCNALRNKGQQIRER